MNDAGKPFPWRLHPDLLLYRRQFLIGPRISSALPAAFQIVHFGGMCVSHHRDLAVAIHYNADCGACLLGEALNPHGPHQSNDDIARELSSALLHSGWSALVEQINRLSGRWFLLVHDGQSTRAYGDAAGTKQAYVYRHGDETWLGSSPGIIANEFHAKVSEEFLDLLAGTDYIANEQYWFPGFQTPFDGIRLLPPNFYADVDTGKSVRFWPVHDRIEGRESLSDVVEACAAIIRSTILAICKRSPLSLPLTAGYDSRVILAACVSAGIDVHIHTWINESCDVNHRDVLIARQLSRLVGAKHHIVPMPSGSHPEFASTYLKNTAYAHPQWCRWCEGLYRHIPDGMVGLRGTISEVARRFYRTLGHTTPDDPRCLAKAACMPEHEWVLRGFQEWVDSVGDTHGYDLFDLFYWEQRDGSWAAMNFTEWDIAQDVVSPYNSRELLERMLSVDEVERDQPECRFHRSMIVAMCPKLLHFPVNPQANPPTRNQKLSQALSRTKNLVGSLVRQITWGRRARQEDAENSSKS